MRSILIFFAVGLIAIQSVFAQQGNTPKTQPSPLQAAATKVLREMPVKMYEGTATDADLQACLKLYELAPNDNLRRKVF